MNNRFNNRKMNKGVTKKKIMTWMRPKELRWPLLSEENGLKLASCIY